MSSLANHNPNREYSFSLSTFSVVHSTRLFEISFYRATPALSLLSSARAAATSASSYPVQPTSPALLRLTISASCAVASSRNFWTVCWLGVGRSGAVSVDVVELDDLVTALLEEVLVVGRE